MARSEANLFVRPLFFDALSGEFVPPSDPKKQTHTLGRLAYAAFVKGEEQVRNPAGYPWVVDFVYRPSWASRVEAMAGVTKKPGGFTLDLLMLADALGNTLEIGEHTGHDGQPRLSIDTRSQHDILPLTLGKDLAAARSQVTRAANSFFISST